ncbi:EamA family transporter [Paraburkholderia bengalensis]|uniref:EamA family transporter n=1 Tax=Paraburkholderia bengalensis TaxID=2747562 RepID=A0ABU8IMM2_9BURK
MNYAALVASGLFGAIASILLRLAGTHEAAGLLLRGLAIVSYGAGFVLYALSLKRIPLTIAYPLMVAVSIISVAIFSAIVEQNVTWRQVSGATIILAGVWVLTWK